MTWHDIVNSTTADNADINDNFNHVAAGSKLPRSSSGSKFVSTDSVYDLGSQANRFFALSCVDCFTITTEELIAFDLISSHLVTSPTSEVSFSGIDNQDKNNYFIIIRGHGADSSAGSSYVTAQLNGDTLSNYMYSRFNVDKLSILIDYTNSSTYMNIGRISATDSVSYIFSTIDGKSGNRRIMVSNIVDSIYKNYTSLSGYGLYTSTWNNKTDTLSSISFSLVNSLNFPIGTEIHLYGRK